MSDSITSKVDRIAREVVAKHAADVDAKGRFPEESVAALAKEGILGAVSARDVGGEGAGPRTAAEIVERLARECGSTAMVVTMHFAAVAVLERHAPKDVRSAAAKGEHLGTLAFSEAGSRSQFWAPVGTAAKQGNEIALSGKKTFVTSATRATSYVWSSKPLAAEGASTLWLVPRDAKGMRALGAFDGLGLRGNDSAAVVAEDVRVPESARLGPDGDGFDIMLGVVLPWFNVMSAAFCLGLMEAGTAKAAAHASATRFEHAGSTVADLPTVRAYLARMRIKTDLTRGILLDTLAAMEASREDAVLRVLESKAAAGELATEVLDLAMRVCGGAAFRKDIGIERIFRDARAATVMAPTTDVLYDFIGRAACGMELF